MDINMAYCYTIIIIIIIIITIIIIYKFIYCQWRHKGSGV